MLGDGVILLIDAGNTRVKFGWMNPLTGKREPDTTALPHADLDSVADWLATLPGTPVRALGASVASQALAGRIQTMLARDHGISVEWVQSSSAAAGILNLYEEPARLGTDRWVSLIGLSVHTTHAAILASFGTATTVDTLGPVTTQSDGRHTGGNVRRFEGGIILPGPELMRRSLAQGTAGLPYAAGHTASHPRNTHAAITSGIAAAQAGAVIRQWRAAADVFGSAPAVYCTGGGWPLVSDEVTRALAVSQADLGVPQRAPQWLDAPVLDGLARLAKG